MSLRIEGNDWQQRPPVQLGAASRREQARPVDRAELRTAISTENSLASRSKVEDVKAATEVVSRAAKLIAQDPAASARAHGRPSVDAALKLLVG
jgi:hypothetical protein